MPVDDPTFSKIGSSDQVPVGFALVTMTNGRTFLVNLAGWETLHRGGDIESTILNPVDFSGLKAFCDKRKKGMQ